MDEFHIGDRVEAIVNGYVAVGSTGTVCDISMGLIGVSWDNKFPAGHSCDGHCESGYGRYMNYHQIRLCEDDIDIDVDESSFLQIIS